jgi:glycosyltransferase involved in cell wall biosynthesis
VSRRICLVTTGQPSTNPRLVKEADALAGAGFEVVVIGAHVAPWADDADARLLPARRWRVQRIDWRRERAPLLFWKTRLRHRLAVAAAGLPICGRAFDALAVSRVAFELRRAAIRTPAALYIAHNLGALPAAAAAARAHGAPVGFDAEDFHRGEFAAGEGGSRKRAVARVEARFLPVCACVTAASPMIAEAYAPLRGGQLPVCVLNVMPLQDRPALRRPTADAGPLRAYWFSQTIGPHRGLDDAVRAIGRLPAGAVTLHLRGRWQPDYRTAFDALAASAGVRPDCVESLPPADPGDMVRLAAEYDVGLAIEPGTTPNNAILLSNKVFTYLLAGAALAASSTPGQARLASAFGAAARWYRPGDADGLAEILASWSTDRASLDEARRAAWERGATRFNWDVEQRTFLRVVDGVLSESAVPDGAASRAPVASA